MTTTHEPLLTVRDVADRLQLSEWQVRALIRDKKLPAHNVSSGSVRPSYRVRVSALDTFLRMRRVA